MKREAGYWALAAIVLLSSTNSVFADPEENTRRRRANVNAADPACAEVLAEKKKEPTRGLLGEDDQIFVFDTNVLINDPHAFLRYRGTIVIPRQVLEELDGLKKDQKVGGVAREALRALEGLRKTGELVGDQVIYKIETGAKLMYVTGASSAQEKAMGDSMDDQIVSVAIELAIKHEGKAYLISDDNGVLIRADLLGRPHGLRLSRYAPDRLLEDEPATEGYRGYRELVVPAAVYHRLLDTKSIRPADLLSMIRQDAYFPPLRPNETVVIREEGAASPIEDVDLGLKAPLLRYHPVTGQLVAIPRAYEFEDDTGVKPRNLEQRVALDLALDPDVQFAIFSGRAGSGKNVMSFAGAVAQVHNRAIEKNIYDKILYLRTTATIGEDIGALPGSEEEKIKPHMQAVKDTLAAIEGGLSKQNRNSGDGKNGSDAKLEKKGEGLYTRLTSSKKLVDDRATQFMRGSTITNTLVIIDEAQNFRPNELDALIDRIGPGSKLIVLGDPEQVDPHFLNAMNNGMSVKLRAVEGAFETLPAGAARVNDADLGIIGMVRLWRAERSDVVRANLQLKNQQQQ